MSKLKTLEGLQPWMLVVVSHCLLWLIILGRRSTDSKGGLEGLQADRKTPWCQDAFGQARPKPESPGMAFSKVQGRRSAHQDPLPKRRLPSCSQARAWRDPLVSAEGLGRKPPSPYPNTFLCPPSQVQLGGILPETPSSGSQVATFIARLFTFGAARRPKFKFPHARKPKLPRCSARTARRS